MPSAAKLVANRANAQKSTGPKTQAGRQIAKYNATRHGLAGKQVVLKGEDVAEYEALHVSLRDAYKPVDAAEEALVEEIAQNYWRLQRARAIETETFNIASAGADPVVGFHATPHEFDNIRRYMATIERAYHRAITLLRTVQKDRAGRAAEVSPTSANVVTKPIKEPQRSTSARSFRDQQKRSTTISVSAPTPRQRADTPQPLQEPRAC